MEEHIWHPLIDEAACITCGDCAAVCPTAALAIVNDTAVVVDPAACDYCTLCETICPVHAVTLPYQVVIAGRS